jgi:hypothetical protein
MNSIFRCKAIMWIVVQTPEDISFDGAGGDRDVFAIAVGEGEPQSEECRDVLRRLGADHVLDSHPLFLIQAASYSLDEFII